MLGKNAQNKIKEYLNSQWNNGEQNEVSMFKKIQEKYRNWQAEIIISLVTALLIGSWLFFADVRASMKSTEEQGKVIKNLVEFQQQQVVINNSMNELIKDLRSDIEANNDRQLENYKILTELCIKNKLRPPTYKLR